MVYAAASVRHCPEASSPLRFAHMPDSTKATRVAAHAYDDVRQVGMTYDGGQLSLLTCMANTHDPTVPDGSTTNPPRPDEGPKD
ncbi:hypothetical protein ACIRU3_40475 [Streptomyces sp. NPDC101151]|uniref:hypothetical protein n=1 Tax=Streptomyces sp. NPDC101151 TaxID=3366115 RepID=UPI0037FCF2FE